MVLKIILFLCIFRFESIFYYSSINVHILFRRQSRCNLTNLKNIENNRGFIFLGMNLFSNVIKVNNADLIV